MSYIGSISIEKKEDHIIITDGNKDEHISFKLEDLPRLIEILTRLNETHNY